MIFDLAKVCHCGARVDAIAALWRFLPKGSQGSPGRIAQLWSAVYRPVVTGLTAGFSKRGYVVGSSLLFERRAAEAHPDRLQQLVDELKSETELIITNSSAAALVVKGRSNVPVVAITGADPVATGLIDSLARPGGNITGVGEVAAELSAKRLEVLKDTFPSLSKIAMLWNADDLGITLRYRSAETAARKLGLEVQPLGVREPEDFAAAFAAMERDRPDAILMVTDALTVLNRRRVFEFAAQQKLPTIYEYDVLVRDGGLMSYGPDMGEVYDRAADLAGPDLKRSAPCRSPIRAAHPLPSRDQQKDFGNTWSDNTDCNPDASR